MRVTIIEDYCIGCGLCKRLYPDRFDIKDKCAYAIKSDFGEDEIVFIKDAKLQCPMSAIVIED